MLAGYLVTSQKGQIPSLILGNIFVIAVGFILNYFILDLDYSRIEKVQFEDDDYYYYVTAVGTGWYIVAIAVTLAITIIIFGVLIYKKINNKKYKQLVYTEDKDEK